MTKDPIEAERYLPLKPKVMLLLLGLLDRPAHGYALMKAVRERSHGQVSLGPGTLYRLIAWLLDEGLIEASDERPDPELDDERRRYYQLTGLGLAVIRAEGQRLAQMVDALRARGVLGDPEVVS